MKQATRIPTLLAFLILVLGLGGGIFLVENRTSLFSRAYPSSTPREVTVSNITDTGFTVSWLTDVPVASVVRVKAQNPFATPTSQYDDRDQNEVLKRYTHSVSVSGLASQTTYGFEIVSRSLTFADQDYLVTTGSTLASPTHSIDPAFGMVSGSDKDVTDNAIVYTSFQGSQILSTLVEEGKWVIPLGTMRTADGANYFIPSTDDKEIIRILHKNGTAVIYTSIQNDSPIPVIELGQKKTDHLFAAMHDLLIPPAHAAENSLSIVSPENYAAIPSNYPGFKGTGISGQQVTLTVSGNSQTPQSGKVIVSTQGSWYWAPQKSLSPGSYTISAASFDDDHNPVAIAHTFKILKSGSQVLQAATPSASIAPSPSPLASPSPKVAASPQATDSSIPVSGTWEPTFIALFGSMLLTGFGLIAFQRTKE